MSVAGQISEKAEEERDENVGASLMREVLLVGGTSLC